MPVDIKNHGITTVTAIAKTHVAITTRGWDAFSTYSLVVMNFISSGLLTNSKTSTSQRKLTLDESRRQNKVPVSCCSWTNHSSWGTFIERENKEGKHYKVLVTWHKCATGDDENVQLSIYYCCSLWTLMVI